MIEVVGPSPPRLPAKLKDGVRGARAPASRTTGMSEEAAGPWVVVLGMHRSGTSAVTGAIGPLVAVMAGTGAPVPGRSAPLGRPSPSSSRSSAVPQRPTPGEGAGVDRRLNHHALRGDLGQPSWDRIVRGGRPLLAVSTRCFGRPRRCLGLPLLGQPASTTSLRSVFGI